MKITSDILNKCLAASLALPTHCTIFHSPSIEETYVKMIKDLSQVGCLLPLNVSKYEFGCSKIKIKE